MNAGDARVARLATVSADGRPHVVPIAEGSFDAVATDPRVVEAYLGLRRAETK